MAALDDLSIIRVAGEQRFDYLHGQITVATKDFNSANAKLAAHCDFKGKMFAAMMVSEFNDAFLLCMHKESAIESQAQLKKYGVFSKVDIEISEQLYPVGIAGEQNIKHLKVLFPTLSNDAMRITDNEFGQAICFNDNSLRYLCYLTEKGKHRLLDISDTTTFYACGTWNMLEIEAGIANIQEATVGQFVPQMLNFQSIQAIDFDKGCYMGQEVVARTKFLGKNKRATFLLSGMIPNGLVVNAGDNIEMQIGESWRRGGVIVRAAISKSTLHTEAEEGAGSNNNELKILAVMPNDTAPDTVIRLKNTDITLTLQPLPYELTV
ncbi:MAG: folate-binding protein YgfZ [Alphaproteobacteria bacterium]|jgi:folate-binding protein YgfZ